MIFFSFEFLITDLSAQDNSNKDLNNKIAEDLIRTIMKNDLNRLVQYRDAMPETFKQLSTSLLCPAVEVGNLEIIKFLVNEGADINCKGNDEETPLHIAAEYAGADIIKYLCQNGARVDLRNKEGATPRIILIAWEAIFEQRNITTFSKERYGISHTIYLNDIYRSIEIINQYNTTGKPLF